MTPRPPTADGAWQGARGTPPAHTVVTIDGAIRWRRWWADLWQYRGALRSLARRNVRSRYKQAALGMTWALIQPAVQVGIFSVLFGMLAKIPSGDVPYPLFALAGLAPWNLFSKIVSEGAISLAANQHLITKLFFPRIYLVFAAGASAFLDAIVALALLATLMLYFHHPLGGDAWLAVPALGGLVLLTYGLTAWLAAINARWRDVQHTVPFALQIGMFATPVLYRNALVPGRWRWLVALNPLTAFVEVFRSAVLGLPLPGDRILLVSLGVSAAVIVLGFWYFTRSEASIVDVV